jgi:polygalacturonase
LEDNLTIDNVTIDTNRDGIESDSYRNPRISNSGVSSPNDDAIVLKGSYSVAAELASITDPRSSDVTVQAYGAGDNRSRGKFDGSASGRRGRVDGFVEHRIRQRSAHSV